MCPDVLCNSRQQFYRLGPPAWLCTCWRGTPCKRKLVLYGPLCCITSSTDLLGVLYHSHSRHTGQDCCEETSTSICSDAAGRQHRGVCVWGECLCICASVYGNVCLAVFAMVYVCVCLCTTCVRVCVCASICMCVSACVFVNLYMGMFFFNVFAMLYVCVCLCLHVCESVCEHVCVCVHLYVCL